VQFPNAESSPHLVSVSAHPSQPTVLGEEVRFFTFFKKKKQKQKDLEVMACVVFGICERRN
jgi:hypothetical protein